MPPGCCPGVWAMRQSWEKLEASPFSMRAVLELRLLLLAQSSCLGLKPGSSVVDPGCCHPPSVLVQVLWDCWFWGWGHCPPCQLPCLNGAVLAALHDNCIFSTGELSPWVSHASLLQFAPRAFWLKNFCAYRLPQSFWVDLVCKKIRL